MLPVPGTSRPSSLPDGTESAILNGSTPVGPSSLPLCGNFESAQRVSRRPDLTALLMPEGWHNPSIPPPLTAYGGQTLFPSDEAAIDLFSSSFSERTDILLSRCLSASLAPRTLRDYFYHWRRWVHTCQAQGWTPVPADPTQFARHLSALAQNSQVVGGVSKAISAVNFVHTLNRLPPPGHAPLVAVVQEAVKRELSNPLRQKEPLLPWMVKAIVGTYCTSTSAPWQWVIGTSTLIMFCLMARYDDLAHIRLEPEFCEVHDSHITFFIERRKTDQYGRGQYVDVSASSSRDSPSCPMRIMRQFLAIFGPQGHLLKPYKQGWWKEGATREVDLPLSLEKAMPYQTFLNEFRFALLLTCGLSEAQAKDFGLHSARSGGATAAFRAGISSELTMRQAGVTGHNWRIRYERPDLSSRLAVTRALGL